MSAENEFRLGDAAAAGTIAVLGVGIGSWVTSWFRPPPEQRSGLGKFVNTILWGAAGIVGGIALYNGRAGDMVRNVFDPRLNMTRGENSFTYNFNPKDGGDLTLAEFDAIKNSDVVPDNLKNKLTFVDSTDTVTSPTELPPAAIKAFKEALKPENNSPAVNT